MALDAAGARVSVQASNGPRALEQDKLRALFLVERAKYKKLRELSSLRSSTPVTCLFTGHEFEQAVAKQRSEMDAGTEEHERTLQQAEARIQ
mgnify:CR=1 FL=1